MYVLPYLMAPPGGPLDQWAAGVELTDSRVVVLHMIRMARVGVDYLNQLSDQASFVRGVHVTGDLDNLDQGTPDDKRHFVTVADERLLLHYGSSYGGNALLGKIAHGLRQASYDGYASGTFLAEQFMLIAILDKETGRTYHICGGFPSASGKTNLAMMKPPASMVDRYEVTPWNRRKGGRLGDPRLNHIAAQAVGCELDRDGARNGLERRFGRSHRSVTLPGQRVPLAGESQHSRVVRKEPPFQQILGPVE